jgi:hypothetical protein
MAVRSSDRVLSRGAGLLVILAVSVALWALIGFLAGLL